MKLIRSRDNPLVKHLLRLTQSSRERSKAGQTVLDGVHLVEAYLESHGMPEAILVSESGARHPEIQALIGRLQQPQPVMLADGLFAESASVTTPVGIVAIINTPSVAVPSDGLGVCLMLEKIQDPGNLGTLLRSAAASGIERVLLSAGCAFAWAPRVVRAGMGAHFRLAIHEGVSLTDVAEQFRGRILAATLQGEQAYFDADLTGTIALLIGNEGAGLSPELLAKAHQQIRIPMVPGVESLNAGVAGSILMFERLRQQLQLPPSPRS